MEGPQEQAPLQEPYLRAHTDDLVALGYDWAAYALVETGPPQRERLIDTFNSIQSHVGANHHP